MKGEKNDNINLRYNIIVVIICIIGFILLLQLFNLQIINGNDYRAMSSARLTRETTVYADRGEILDRNGVKFVTTSTGYSLDLYKTTTNNDELNNNIILTDELEYIPKLLNLTNVVLSTAKAEGISANLVKAMVQCKPIIATDVRGNKELLKQKNLVKNTDELIKKMSICINANKSKEIYETQKYEVENVLQEVFGLYTWKKIHLMVDYI